MSVTDHELARQAGKGDEAAFDRLVRRHTPRMYRVALRITGSPAEAEDAVQDAWISAWRNLPTFRADAAVSTWLYRVVTNAALAQLRKRKPTVSLDAALLDEPDSPGLLDTAVLAEQRIGPEGRAVQADEMRAVFRAIASLELSQRVPFVLRELEGLSYEELVEVTGVNITALRSRVHRARVAVLGKLRETS